MKHFKRWAALLCVMLLIAGTALASVPYRTYTMGVDGDYVQTQAAYEPVRSMTRFGEETLKTPADMRLGPDGNLYIADSGNCRIVVITMDGELVKTIGNKKQLKSPNGVFVDDELNVYVADENARKVVVFNQDGEIIKEYGRPDHPLFGGKAPYKPNKLVLDSRGNLYISSTGSTSGIIQISPVGEGEFLGYYGANTSTVSWLTALKKAVFTEEQLSTMAGIVPASVKNLCIDEKGMVYTVSQATDASSLRRLNVAGRNTLTPEGWTEQNTAVAVNSAGSIFTVSASGEIMEYTSEGNVLFRFGSFDYGDQRVGTFKSVTGLIVTDDYEIYVLDEILGSIQVLRPTEFTDLVHEAFQLFQDGKYTESEAPWREVLRMNSLFTYANTGLGEAQYREGNFEEAMDSFRSGGYKSGYSDAYWEVRSNWLHSHMGVILIVIVAFIAVRLIVKAVDKKTNFLQPVRNAAAAAGNVGIIKQVGWCFTMLKNPFDCCYGIKREKRASWLSAVIVMVIFFVLYVLGKYASGFLFRTTREGQYELLRDVVMVFGVWLLLVICGYLVCTIKDGEARFKDLFIGSAYALAPMLIFMPIRLVLTNVLTYNEEFFITLIDVVSIGWTVVLILLAIMYLNDYTMKKTITIVLWTAFTVLVVVALMFVMYVLITQLWDFVASIYGEVVYRFVKKL